MAEMSGMPPILRLRRSAQSGNKAMTLAWQVIYYEDTATSLLAYIFGGGQIDLTNMQAGDTIDIRIRKRMVSGGNLVNHDQLQYNDAQPANHPSVSISGIPNVYGIEIAMRQTAGVLRTLGMEFYDAKRLGLA
jgi:hypothetical protein